MESGLTVNPVFGIPASRNHESVLASARFGATWPASVVAAERVGTGSVASHCVGSEVDRKGERGSRFDGIGGREGVEFWSRNVEGRVKGRDVVRVP